MAEEEEQHEHSINGNLSNLQPAFMAYYKKE